MFAKSCRERASHLLPQQSRMPRHTCHPPAQAKAVSKLLDLVTSADVRGASGGGGGLELFALEDVLHSTCANLRGVGMHLGFSYISWSLLSDCGTGAEALKSQIGSPLLLLLDLSQAFPPLRRSFL